MNVFRNLILILVLVTAFSFSAPDKEPVYWDVVEKIMEEGFKNSHIMEDVSYMTDVFGPRLAKSPAYLAAAKWAKKKFEEYGLENVHLEPFEFGIGWNLEYTSVHMLSPQYMPIIAYPQAWSSPTKGKVRGSVVYINFREITSAADLAKYKGKLRNAIIFTAPKQKMYLRWMPEAALFSDEMLDEMAQIPATKSEEEYIRNVPRRIMPLLVRHGLPPVVYKYPRRKIIDFLLSEGIAAIAATDGLFDDGTVEVTKVARGAWKKDAPKQPTSFILAAEHYNRIMRILEKGIPVEMEVELRATYSDKNLTDYNVIAELPGTDLADEVVLLGGHYDGHIGGTGAEDNACGVAHVMEAARILKAIGIKPRRTIRFAAWGASENGPGGYNRYISKHYVDRKTGQYTKEHEKFAGYYNLDYGTGRIRGIYLDYNYLAKPIFTEWMKPFHDLGMRHCFLIPSFDTGGSGVFGKIGLPSFKFCQDPVENDFRTYHSNMDVYDRIVPEYLKQGAVVVASFAYHTAMRDKKLPRVSSLRK